MRVGVAISLGLGLAFAAAGSAPAGPGGGALAVGDFNGDGGSDIVLTNGADLVFWFMHQRSILGGSGGIPASSTYAVKGSGDFGDGSGADPSSDLVLQNPSNDDIVIWFMDGKTVTGARGLGAPAGYVVEGIGNFDAAAGDDLLLRDGSGNMAIWNLDEQAQIDLGSSGTMAVLSLDWTVERIADFDGQYGDDILLRNDSLATPLLAFWFMNGKNLLGTSGTIPAPAAYDIAAAADVDGDGIADLLLQDPATGRIYAWFMSGMVVTDATELGSTAYDAVEIGDFRSAGADPGKEGDADLLLREASTGNIALWYLADDASFNGGGGIAESLTAYTIVTAEHGE